ncbi:MOSC domain-containing protein [Pseudomaricurvus sp. HS19]|uniref:MOSC domain-containing protein n=1 Tax=Pseudomaricurvus sp. HS19 TaxID=2692626 RepID=UPI0013711AFE|nr:MOSC domain-containing protein [Pseudomaricurvus sp. HS19]MYM61961.1 MOSC domain-containing protein [Pseudomaricurvus sp. HS19]
MRGNIEKLLATLPQQGTLEKILLRPSRELPMVSVDRVGVVPGLGLEGDRFKGRVDSKRQVTLYQAENLAVLASLLHRETIDPALLRRNLLVQGINLHALSGRRFRIGEVLFEGAGQCHPCSRMESALGAGGFNAMRGMGGLCAKVLSEGTISLGDAVVALADEQQQEDK